MNEDDPVRSIDEERLCLFIVRCVAASGVANVAKADVSGEIAHIASAERLANLTLGLRHVKGATFARCDAGRVLAAMLKKGEGVINLLVDGSR